MPFLTNISSYILALVPGLVVGSAVVVSMRFSKRLSVSFGKKILLIATTALIAAVAEKLGERFFAYNPPHLHLGPDWAMLAFIAGCGAVWAIVGSMCLRHPLWLKAGLDRAFMTDFSLKTGRRIAIFAIALGLANVALALPFLVLEVR